MKKVRLVALALFVATVVWAVIVYNAYAQVSSSPPSERTSPRAVQAYGPGDYVISAFEVRPTENVSEWICEVYYRGELMWNWTIVGTYKGELSDPLNTYLKEAIENQGWVIRLTEVMTLEEFNLLLPENDIVYNSSAAYHSLGIYKHNETYYSFEKSYSKTRFYDLLTPHDEYVIRHTVQLQAPTIGSGASIGACWIGFAIYAVRQRKQEDSHSPFLSQLTQLFFYY